VLFVRAWWSWLARSASVECGVGSVIVVHGGYYHRPRSRGEELLAVSWRMEAFCVVGGEELLAVS